jgi:acyl dehydratase
MSTDTARDVEVLDRLPATGPMLARAALTSVGRPGARAGLPRRSVVLHGLEQDADRLAGYSRVCGFTLRDRVPPTWLHVLTFPLQTHLLTSRDFPFAPAGMVHVANRMTLHRPVEVGERLDLEVHVDNLRAHRAGVALDVVEWVGVGEETVWDGVSTYLVKGARMPEGASAPETAPDAGRSETAELPSPWAVWRLHGGLGRDYAAVSGDVNPIHVNTLAAKAFGFPRTIVHGMWTHARALAALGGRLPDAYATSVEFRKPVLLPSTVAFGARPAGGGWEFAVTSRDGERVHLTGRVDPRA